MSRSEPPATLDITLARIDAFNESQGGGVAAKKTGAGYSLFREDTGEPLARLRPVGLADRFEVLYWSHRERWEAIGLLGGVHLPLDEALEFVAEDPMGCFWH